MKVKKLSDMFKVPEKFRITPQQHPYLGTTPDYNNNGAFAIPVDHGWTAYVIASDGEQWEHVSVHLRKDNVERIPTWEIMCFIKDLFWSESDRVVQYHPPRSEYVNNHKHTLHLWRPIYAQLPAPPPELVGIV